MGEKEQARSLFNKLLAMRTSLGLLSEEYDPKNLRLIGNFPQAFSHIGLINTAQNLSPEALGPAEIRSIP
jgi:GH15 family glucan-1,4-alpha-glucosidase